MSQTLNLIDKLIAFIDPVAGASRARARFGLTQLERLAKRHFEGASSGRRTKGWHSPSTSVNAANGPALHRLRDRSRDLVRNNPYAARAVDAIASNMVGTGILPQPRARAARNAKALGLAWVDWAETTACDSDGLMSFYGLQWLMAKTIVEGGEVLVRRRWRNLSDGFDIPMQLQVLEGDHLDTEKNAALANGGRIVQGVEYDVIGRRAAYWLFPEHPGGDAIGAVSGRWESKRVDAKDVIHLFRVERAGQVRGVPWLAPCVIRLRDFDEYEDFQLVRQKIAACFTAFIQDIAPPADPDEAADDVGDRLEPGLIQNLGPGKTVTFANAPGVSDDGHRASILRGIAAGVGVPYEVLTGDYSQVNFSSARMGRGEFNRALSNWQYHMMIPRLCHGVWGWFREAAAISGVRGALEVSASWTPPRKELVDPTREIPAKIAEIRAGLISLPEAIRENGFDPREQLDEIKAFNDQLDLFGIKLDSDARNPASGSSGAAGQGAKQDGAKDGPADAGDGEKPVPDEGVKDEAGNA